MTWTWPYDSSLLWACIGLAIFAVAIGLCRAHAAGRVRTWRVGAWLGLLCTSALIAGTVPTIVLIVLMNGHWPAPGPVLWTIAASATGTGGLWLLAWVVAGDPARGRRRCPRCWYDMSATPGRACPECGPVRGRERSLLRTRRRWRRLALPTLAFAMAGVLRATPRLIDGAWIQAVPDAALVAIFPDLPTDSRLYEEFGRRFCFANGEPWHDGWRHWHIVNRATAALAGDDTEMQSTAMTMLCFYPDDDPANTTRLIDLAQHGKPGIRAIAVNTLGGRAVHLDRAFPVIVEALDDPAPGVRTEGARAITNLSQQPRDLIEAPPRLIEMAAHEPDRDARVNAIAALGSVKPTAETLKALWDCREDPDDRVRGRALFDLARTEPDRDRIAGELLAAAREGDAGTRTGAVLCLARQGPYTPEVLDLIARFAELGEDAQPYAFEVLGDVAKAPIPLQVRLGVLERAFHFPATRQYALYPLAALGTDLTQTLGALEERQSRAMADEDQAALRWCADAIGTVETAMAARRRQAESP